MMDRQSKDQTETDAAIKEFLEKGGVIQQIPAGQRSESIDYKGGFYGKRKTKKEADKK
jgi:hypothetical protein